MGRFVVFHCDACGLETQAQEHVATSPAGSVVTPLIPLGWSVVVSRYEAERSFCSSGCIARTYAGNTAQPEDEQPSMSTPNATPAVDETATVEPAEVALVEEAPAVTPDPEIESNGGSSEVAAEPEVVAPDMPLAPAASEEAPAAAEPVAEVVPVEAALSDEPEVLAPEEA